VAGRESAGRDARAVPVSIPNKTKAARATAGGPTSATFTIQGDPTDLGPFTVDTSKTIDGGI
jgi:hypothetical protein